MCALSSPEILQAGAVKGLKKGIECINNHTGINGIIMQDQT